MTEKRSCLSLTHYQWETIVNALEMFSSSFACESSDYKRIRNLISLIYKEL